MQLDGATENLRLFKADVLDYDTLTAAFAGCDGVFHAATPVPDGKLVFFRLTASLSIQRQARHLLRLRVLI
jgi:nucleoside-diphosphate-sugar epimerase